MVKMKNGFLLSLVVDFAHRVRGWLITLPAPPSNLDARVSLIKMTTLDNRNLLGAVLTSAGSFQHSASQTTAFWERWKGPHILNTLNRAGIVDW